MAYYLSIVAKYIKKGIGLINNKPIIGDTDFRIQNQ